jgi:2-keto-4-pentenoate hydratase/2-oxohepta-3-ene-1,7-dioic acid hydratase in catechol pathway
MKLAFFDDFRLGVVVGSDVVDVSDIVEDIPHMGPHQIMSGLIEQFEQYRPKLEQAASSRKGVPLSSVRLRSPLPKPGKMVCMARNYMENGTLTEKPTANAFLKSPATVVGDGDTIVLTKDKPTIVEHEAELGVVIGKTASNVKAADWREYVFGYVNFMDVSSRGLGAPPMDSFFVMKSQHTSAPIGPFLVTADEIPDPLDLDVKLWVSGDIRQDFHTSDMAHKIPDALEWASSITTLDPGDLFATGTNHRGLGPLQDGDTVEMEVEGLGRLALKVRDDLHREWPRETRLQKEMREAAKS